MYSKKIIDKLTYLENVQSKNSNLIKFLNNFGLKDTYKNIKKEYIKDEENLLIDMIETLLLYLNKDEFEVYTAYKIKRIINRNYKPEIVKIIKNEIEKMLNSNLESELEKFLELKNEKKKETIKETIEKTVDTLSKENVVNYILELFDRKESSRKDFELKMFSTFARKEFLAAILVSVIKD